MQNTNPRAVLLASPGMGHFTPLLELGKRLATHHGFDVTIFVVAADASITESPLFKPPQTPNMLNLVLLPLVDISALVDHTTSVATQLMIMMREALPSLRATISAMKYHPTALIVDMFGTEALAIAKEFDMLNYVFITSTAWFLAVIVHFPYIDEEAEHKHRVMKRPLDIPGCRSIRYEDTLDLFLDQADRNLCSGFTRVGMEISSADGILVNTWQDLEPLTLHALENDKLLSRVVKASVYPVGPLVRPVEQSSKGEVMDWLDMQPMESVIYVSFGSGGTLSAKQTSELAWGLELSQHRFIWVVRPPVEGDVSANFFNVTNSHDGTPSYLPSGFFGRIHDRGRVVPMWAPQTEILAHKSIGGFFSHCGWNSTLESMVNGVPMVAWPLYAEQQMNAAMLAEELEVAVRPKKRPNAGLIEREEIAELVRRVMELKGNKMRNKVKELQRSANQVLKQGGSSYDALSRVSKECELKLHHRLSAMALGA